MPPARSDGALYLDKPEQVDRFLNQISGVTELASIRGRELSPLPRPHLSPPALHARAQRDHRPASHRITSWPRSIAPEQVVEVVFHDADYDLRLLHQDYGWHVTNIFDTRIASQLLGIKSFGSPRCSSSSSMSNWTKTSARRLVDAALRPTCSNTRRRTRATCCS